MKKKIEFAKLGHETQAEIVRTLMCYDECHIEHAHGQNRVTTNYCVRATYPNDFWVSEDFYSKDFDFDGFDYTTAWDNVTKFWDIMTDNQRSSTVNKFEEMVDMFIDLVIQKYLLKKQNN